MESEFHQSLIIFYGIFWVSYCHMENLFIFFWSWFQRFHTTWEEFFFACFTWFYYQLWRIFMYYMIHVYIFLFLWRHCLNILSEGCCRVLISIYFPGLSMDHDEFISQEIFWIHLIWRFWGQKAILSGPVKNHTWEISCFVLFHEGLQVNTFMFYLLSLRSWNFTLFSGFLGDCKIIMLKICNTCVHLL